MLPDGIPSLSIEVMSTLGWEKYSHEQFGLNRFGASGPYKEVYDKFEFNAAGVAKSKCPRINVLLSNTKEAYRGSPND